MKKIQLLSDVHNEFIRNGSEHYDGRWCGSIPKIGADIVVLAGDIDTKHYAIEWCVEEAERLGIDILYVFGNHEFYRSEYYSLKEEVKKLCEGTSVHILDCDVFDFEGEIRFLGCTLWTNYQIENYSTDSVRKLIQSCIRDHSVIDINSGGKLSKFLTEHALTLHNTELNWLKKQLNIPYSGKTVVVTHHGPHPVCQHPQYPVDEITAAFHSDLSDVLEKYSIDVWMCGHTHANIDAIVSNTRIITNQAGYPGENVSGFDPNLLVYV